VDHLDDEIARYAEVFNEAAHFELKEHWFCLKAVLEDSYPKILTILF